MKVNYSKFAEIELSEEWLSNNKFEQWLDESATFSHKDSYEFIHHLFEEETEDFFVTNCLNESVPLELKEMILKARRDGAARICFYC